MQTVDCRPRNVLWLPIFSYFHHKTSILWGSWFRKESLPKDQLAQLKFNIVFCYHDQNHIKCSPTILTEGNSMSIFQNSMLILLIESYALVLSAWHRHTTRPFLKLIVVCRYTILHCLKLKEIRNCFHPPFLVKRTLLFHIAYTTNTPFSALGCRFLPVFSFRKGAASCFE